MALAYGNIVVLSQGGTLLGMAAIVLAAPTGTVVTAADMGTGKQVTFDSAAVGASGSVYQFGGVPVSPKFAVGQQVRVDGFANPAVVLARGLNGVNNVYLIHVMTSSGSLANPPSAPGSSNQGSSVYMVPELGLTVPAAAPPAPPA